MPTTPTRSVGLTSYSTSGLNTVEPAQNSGPAMPLLTPERWESSPRVIFRFFRS